MGASYQLGWDIFGLTTVKLAKKYSQVIHNLIPLAGSFYRPPGWRAPELLERGSHADSFQFQVRPMERGQRISMLPSISKRFALFKISSTWPQGVLLSLSNLTKRLECVRMPALWQLTPQSATESGSDLHVLPGGDPLRCQWPCFAHVPRPKNNSSQNAQAPYGDLNFGVLYLFYFGTRNEFFNFIEQNRIFDSLGQDLGLRSPVSRCMLDPNSGV